MDPDRYRSALKRFASGVTLVTTSVDGVIHGMTASSFASVSLEPPLILVSLEKGSRTHELVTNSMRFGVNILSQQQEQVAKKFSQKGAKSFDGIPFTLEEGIPHLDEAISFLLCTTTHVAPGGDHDVFVAEVLSTHTRDGDPLLYYDRDYRALGGSST